MFSTGYRLPAVPEKQFYRQQAHRQFGNGKIPLTVSRAPYNLNGQLALNDRHHDRRWSW
jgi:hypothetical protein